MISTAPSKLMLEDSTSMVVLVKRAIWRLAIVGKFQSTKACANPSSTKKATTLHSQRNQRVLRSVAFPLLRAPSFIERHSSLTDKRTWFFQVT